MSKEDYLEDARHFDAEAAKLDKNGMHVAANVYRERAADCREAARKMELEMAK